MRTTKAQIRLRGLRSLISTFVFRCLDSIISLVSISEISSLYLATVAAQAGLSLTWSQTPKTDFLVTWLSVFEPRADHLDRVKRIWYLSPMRAAKVQASLRIRAVSPEPSLLAHTSSESRRTFRQKARSLAPVNGWACAVKICHDGMPEDTISLDGEHFGSLKFPWHN